MRRPWAISSPRLYSTIAPVGGGALEPDAVDREAAVGAILRLGGRRAGGDQRRGLGRQGEMDADNRDGERAGAADEQVHDRAVAAAPGAADEEGILRVARAEAGG